MFHGHPCRLLPRRQLHHSLALCHRRREPLGVCVEGGHSTHKTAALALMAKLSPLVGISFPYRRPHQRL